MKKNFVLAATFALLAMAFTVSAQKAPADFSGKWNLDLAKSKLSDREKASIESQTVTITQTAADIKVETETKRIAPPAGATPPAGGGGGGGRMGGGGGAGGPQTYPLGKEVTTDQTMGQNTVPVTMGSKWDGSKLVTTRAFTMNTPNGEFKSLTKQTFELGADGKSLTLTVESTNAQGTTSSTKVFTKG
jgi:hypothetical protein